MKVGILVFAVWFSLSSVWAAERSPNFILFLTDDQSWVGTSHEMIHGDARTKSDYFQTPHLEAFAAEGLTFSDGYAPAPFCCPTRRSIAIGQMPAKHIYQKDQKNWTARYREQLTIPRVLKVADPAYKAAHFGKWDFRFDELTPEEAGYDVSDGYTSNDHGGGKDGEGPYVTEDPKLARTLTEKAVRFMEEQVASGTPFYLQVSHYAVHLETFSSREQLDRVSKREKGLKHDIPGFAAMTGDLDDALGALMDQVKTLGIEDHTYIIYMSDNGGRTSMPGHARKEGAGARNYPLNNGKGKMYEGGIRVPFLVKGPGVPKGSVSREPVNGVDILPTLADLAGFDLDQLPDQLDGGSMTAVLRDPASGKVERERDFMLWHHAVDRSPQTALRKGDYKLVKSWPSEKVELFNLKDDLGETRDLSEKMPEKKAELHQLMLDYLTAEKVATQVTGGKTGKKKKKSK
jgi:arylsulfatase A